MTQEDFVLAKLAIIGFDNGAEGDGGEGGEADTGGSDDLESILSRDDVKAAMAKMIEKEVSGLKSKNSELLGKLSKVKESHGEDSAKYQALLQQIEDEKDQADLAAGRLTAEQLIDRRVQAANKSWQAKLAAKEEEIGTYKSQLEEKENAFRTFRVRDVFTRSIASREDVLRTATDDILGQATRDSWVVGEDGELELRDKDGNKVLGDKGEPLTVDEYIEKLKDSKPHYFRQPEGTGASGGHGKGGAKVYTLQAWQQAIMDANDEERTKLNQAKRRGEIVIRG